MNWLKQQYGPLKFLITENGVPNLGSNLNDTGRVEFFESYLSQVMVVGAEKFFNEILLIGNTEGRHRNDRQTT